MSDRGHPTFDQRDAGILVVVSGPILQRLKKMETCLVYCVDKGLSVVAAEASDYLDLILV